MFIANPYNMYIQLHCGDFKFRDRKRLISRVIYFVVNLFLSVCTFFRFDMHSNTHQNAPAIDKELQIPEVYTTVVNTYTLQIVGFVTSSFRNRL